MAVTLYSKNDCVQCKKTKQLMDSLGVSYEEINIEGDVELIAKLKEEGFGSAPIVKTDEDSWSGFRPDRIKKIQMGNKKRGFELVKGESNMSLLPKRSTSHSAGYDFKASKTVVIEPKEIKFVPTGVKAYMQEGEVLKVYDRSSNPRKKGIVLVNSVGIIDKDYYGNPENDGHIQGIFTNITDRPVIIEEGQSIMQGVFQEFLLADGDNAMGERKGGFGSTGD